MCWRAAGNEGPDLSINNEQWNPLGNNCQSVTAGTTGCWFAGTLTLGSNEVYALSDGQHFKVLICSTKIPYQRVTLLNYYLIKLPDKIIICRPARQD